MVTNIISFRGNSMSKIVEITKEYSLVKRIPQQDAGKKISALFAFEDILLSEDSKDILEFNYECLNDTSDWRLYLFCRDVFVKRNIVSEEFLLKKLLSETRSHLRGDIIHILGGIRSCYAATIAMENLNDPDSYIREVCLYVLGWTGDSSSLMTLSEHLGKEKLIKLRVTAASAMRQVFWRLPETKFDILNYLKNSYYSEDVMSVKSRLIEIISSISGKNLGIREDRNDPDVLIGDLDKAIKKTNNFLNSF